MRNPLKNTSKVAATVFWVVVTIIPMVGIAMSLADPLAFYESQRDFRSFVETFGRWAPLAFVLLQAVQVIVTPLSHYSVGFMGGFLFGQWWGALYNYVGRLLGHIAAFYLSRGIARPIVRRFVPEETVERYDQLVSDRADVLFLIYFLPLFPDDEISYLAGLSKMKSFPFLVANALGHLGGSLSLAYLGAGVDTNDPLFWALLISTLAGFPILWWQSRKSRAKQ